MRDKFGTNERKIENVLEKRDWEAFSEMLEFGYRMNRKHRKTKQSALTTFLDRVPNDKFDPEQVEQMIKLGANINDQSVQPRDEEDVIEKDKIGDNVLIRYTKVTPWYASSMTCAWCVLSAWCLVVCACQSHHRRQVRALPK